MDTTSRAYKEQQKARAQAVLQVEEYIDSASCFLGLPAKLPRRAREFFQEALNIINEKLGGSHPQKAECEQGLKECDIVEAAQHKAVSVITKTTDCN